MLTGADKSVCGRERREREERERREKEREEEAPNT